ncbi:MAG: YggT family protein [Candidatus Krumholzibacteria bacterium]|nr:YggT family protein [Candidatus Krumholzibacteria bacterium]
MGLFIADTVGLVLAFCNTATFVLLLYSFLTVAGVRRSKVYRALDRILGPVLAPLKRLTGGLRFDPSPLIAAALVQLIAFAVRKNGL